MQKRHDANLENRIEELYRVGFAKFYFWELYLWYDADRLSKNVFRDIDARYREAGGESVLQQIETRDFTIILEADELSDVLVE
ncbi:hypothetical protein BD830_11187 [Maritimibacter alkaliphilus HTCC2654]|uniref:Uncharacterized protein n=1 Tax=Maritimibacter alkaliphilus HTCC2654 TaxID=314271 RepID=A3VFD3_9RHOB|nr:hypothetical protein RB2654_11138 [Rhodobacterales bacterium HTCC2654] [Maritimibacter alkaliphilus HTCC2654]TYP79982.1 hypothetical protein BD830_11187 [Maritimibacter alkaliphilus HTCC2654]